jgi:adenine phosphoribosyltransferase
VHSGPPGYSGRVPSADALAHAESLIRSIPDYPEPGILFRDITPLLADAVGLRTAIDALVAPFAGTFDVVAGVEARGFLLAGAVAIAANTGLVPVRKAGKLPRPAASVSYTLEYGEAAIEVHDDLAPGTRVFLVDDVLATGGTLAAAHSLFAQLGASIVGTAVLMELEALGGRELVGDVHTVFRG